MEKYRKLGSIKKLIILKMFKKNCLKDWNVKHVEIIIQMLFLNPVKKNMEKKRWLIQNIMFAGEFQSTRI